MDPRSAAATTLVPDESYGCAARNNEVFCARELFNDMCKGASRINKIRKALGAAEVKLSIRAKLNQQREEQNVKDKMVDPAKAAMAACKKMKEARRAGTAQAVPDQKWFTDLLHKSVEEPRPSHAPGAKKVRARQPPGSWRGNPASRKNLGTQEAIPLCPEIRPQAPTPCQTLHSPPLPHDRSASPSIARRSPVASSRPGTSRAGVAFEGANADTHKAVHQDAGFELPDYVQELLAEQHSGASWEDDYVEQFQDILLQGPEAVAAAAAAAAQSVGLENTSGPGDAALTPSLDAGNIDCLRPSTAASATSPAEPVMPSAHPVQRRQPPPTAPAVAVMSRRSRTDIHWERPVMTVCAAQVNWHYNQDSGISIPTALRSELAPQICQERRANEVYRPLHSRTSIPYENPVLEQASSRHAFRLSACSAASGCEDESRMSTKQSVPENMSVKQSGSKDMEGSQEDTPGNSAEESHSGDARSRNMRSFIPRHSNVTVVCPSPANNCQVPHDGFIQRVNLSPRFSDASRRQRDSIQSSPFQVSQDTVLDAPSLGFPRGEALDTIFAAFAGAPALRKETEVSRSQQRYERLQQIRERRAETPSSSPQSPDPHQRGVSPDGQETRHEKQPSPSKTPDPIRSRNSREVTNAAAREQRYSEQVAEHERSYGKKPPLPLSARPVEERLAWRTSGEYSSSKTRSEHVARSPSKNRTDDAERSTSKRNPSIRSPSPSNMSGRESPFDMDSPDLRSYSKYRATDADDTWHHLLEIPDSPSYSPRANKGQPNTAIGMESAKPASLSDKAWKLPRQVSAASGTSVSPSEDMLNAWLQQGGLGLDDSPRHQDLRQSDEAGDDNVLPSGLSGGRASPLSIGTSGGRTIPSSNEAGGWTRSVFDESAGERAHTAKAASLRPSGVGRGPQMRLTGILQASPIRCSTNRCKRFAL